MPLSASWRYTGSIKVQVGQSRLATTISPSVGIGMGSILAFLYHIAYSPYRARPQAACAARSISARTFSSGTGPRPASRLRSEEHTAELQLLMRISSYVL